MMRPLQRNILSGWTPKQVALKIGLPILVIVIIIIVIATSVSSGKKPSPPPDVANFSLISVDNGTFSLTWQAPDYRVDKYWIQVSDNAAAGGGDPGRAHRAGSCGNGTFVDGDRTHLRCDNVEPCTNITVTVHVLNFDHTPNTSPGKSLLVFVPEQRPDPPSYLKSSINTASAVRIVRIEWQPPETASSASLTYDVKVCDAPLSCDAVSNCSIPFNSKRTWVERNESEVSRRCVLVEAVSVCFGKVERSEVASLRVTGNN